MHDVGIDAFIGEPSGGPVGEVRGNGGTVEIGQRGVGRVVTAGHHEIGPREPQFEIRPRFDRILERGVGGDERGVETTFGQPGRGVSGTHFDELDVVHDRRGVHPIEAAARVPGMGEQIEDRLPQAALRRDGDTNAGHEGQASSSGAADFMPTKACWSWPSACTRVGSFSPRRP